MSAFIATFKSCFFVVVTAFVIANTPLAILSIVQRLSVLRHMDRIVVVDDGQTIEQGNMLSF